MKKKTKAIKKVHELIGKKLIFMFAIVTFDEAGQTIQLFKTQEQASQFYKELQKHL